jgi:hypothetical protein
MASRVAGFLELGEFHLSSNPGGNVWIRMTQVVKGNIGSIGGVSWGLGVTVGYDTSTYIVPEPDTDLLVGLGLILLTALGRTRNPARVVR